MSSRNAFGRFAAVLAFAAAAAPVAGESAPTFVLHGQMAYDVRTMVRRAAVPTDAAPVVAIQLARDELEPGVLAITNTTSSQSLDLKVLMQRPQDESTRLLPPANLRLATVAMQHVRETDYEKPEAIIPLGHNLITVPPGESRYLWMTVDGRGLADGEYRIELRIVPVNSIRPMPEEQTAQVLVTVWPFSLNEVPPPRVWTWDYAVGIQNETWAADFREHRVNCWHIPLAKPPPLRPDGSISRQPPFTVAGAWGRKAEPLGAFVGRARQTEVFLIDTGTSRAFTHIPTQGQEPGWRRTDGQVETYMSPVWQKGLGQYLRELVRYLKDHGVGYDRWYWYPYDEYMGEEFLAQAELVRRIDSGIRIFVDDFKGDTDLVRRWVPNADLWVPQRSRILQEEKDFEAFRSLLPSDARIGIYFAGLKYRPLCPNVLWRGISWHAARLNFDHISFWSPTGFGGRVWTSGRWNRFPDCIYRDEYLLHGPGHEYSGDPIDTMKWEAFRDGVDDFLYLKILRTRAKGLAAESPLRARALDAAAEAITRFPYDYPYKQTDSTQLAGFYARRAAMARLIVQLGAP